MINRSGAGASVSSGADFQARVAAYALASALCEADMPAFDDLRASEVGHEVREYVDDLLIHTSNNINVYVQAKRQLVWSLSISADLGSSVAQFAKQHASGRTGLYALATTSASSRRITAELPAALLAFRSGPPEAFFRDQSASLVTLIRDLQAAIVVFAPDLPTDQIDDLLRRMRIARLDLDDGEPLHQAIRIRLAAAGFTPDALIWSKLVANCLDASRRRLTLRVTDLRSLRDRDGSTDCESPENDDIHSQIAFAEGQERLMCGEDWLFGRFEELPGWRITQLRRYDEQCVERTAYLPDGKVRFFGDKLFSIYIRASSYTGLSRLVDRCTNAVAGDNIDVHRVDFVEDPNESPCARQQEERLHRLLNETPRPSDCIRCGLPATQARIDIIETWPGDSGVLEVGIVHDRCRLPLDRVVGESHFPFYGDYPELEGFDIGAWLAAASQGGQGGLGGIAAIGQRDAVMVWSGQKSGISQGAYVIAEELEGGSDFFVTERAILQRFTRAGADALAHNLNRQIVHARNNGDPFCFIPETQQFGNRSALMSIAGVTMEIREVCKVRVTPYTKIIGNRYPTPAPFYAPLSYLVIEDSDEIFLLENAAIILSDPLSLAKYLTNWTAAGIALPKLRLTALLTDDDVDAFMTRIDYEGLFAVINPVISPGDQPRLLSCIRVMSQDRLIASR